MNTRIWRLAGVSLLALSISAQVLADDNNQQQQQQRQQQQQQQQHQQQQRGFEMQRQQQQNQQRFNQDQQQNQNQQREQQQRQQQQQQYQQQRQQEQLNQQRQIQQNQQQRFDQQRQQQDRERNQQQQNQRQEQLQQQQRQQQQQLQQRQLQDRQGNLPIQSRPDTVVQTQQPRQGFYRDQPRDNNNPWRGGDHRPNNGRPGGHGDGWGSGPHYRPGYEIDRMPGGYSRVPYRGNDYFYSGGYWYRPQGPRYVVVAPPRGVRVRYLPDYAQQVWLGSALFFVAAGTYYTYEQSTQEYVVAEPPQGVEPVYSPQQPQQAADPYEVVAYPANGQSQQQFEQDRYDCYRYAVQQSNFDPANASYQPAPEVVGIYRQALAGCYASRGYSVQQ
jgi:hypothetical protein